MCRVLLMNKKGEQEIENIYGLTKYLKYLEDRLGGHGNGFALLKNGKVIRLEKGVNLDIRDIANIIRKTNYDWCLFHTRLASKGIVCDKNCHPFKRDDFVLAMNGTENSVSFLSEIKDITDTEAILETINKYHLGLNALKHFNSIFMGFFKGKPFVVADNTNSIKILKDKKTNALAFASEFPMDFTNNNIYQPKECFVWNAGRLPKGLEKYKRRYFRTFSYINPYYQNSLYEQCYIDALNKEKEVNLYEDQLL